MDSSNNLLKNLNKINFFNVIVKQDEIPKYPSIHFSYLVIETALAVRRENGKYFRYMYDFIVLLFVFQVHPVSQVHPEREARKGRKAIPASPVRR